MMEEIGHIDLFERYRHGDLNDLETREFEARLVYDTEFKEHFEQYQQIELGIETHFRHGLKSKLIELDQTIDEEKQKKTKSTVLLLFISSFAALLVVGIILFSNSSKNNYADLANQYWPEEPGLPVKMNAKGRYDDAMNAYKLKDFSKASQLLKTVQTDTSIYFQGVIAFKLDDPEEAKRFFMLLKKGSTYYQKAQFRLGLILLSENELASAKKILRTHVDDNSVYKVVSKELLKKI